MVSPPHLSLTPGTRTGVYEVTAPIGEGGMGQVWRATDTTLGRQVAIKILPDAFASDPERLARFEREGEDLSQRIARDHPDVWRKHQGRTACGAVRGRACSGQWAERKAASGGDGLSLRPPAFRLKRLSQ